MSRSRRKYIHLILLAEQRPLQTVHTETRDSVACYRSSGEWRRACSHMSRGPGPQREGENCRQAEARADKLAMIGAASNKASTVYTLQFTFHTITVYPLDHAVDSHAAFTPVLLCNCKTLRQSINIFKCFKFH